MMSEEAVVKHLVDAARALRAAEDEIRPPTEYLREELKELLDGVSTLFDKVHTEHALLEAREVLHADQ
jgi:hypothetical protein